MGERYQLLEEIGRGGVAAVYRARDTATGRLIAVKRFEAQRQGPGVAAALGLFEREFHTLFQLSHPRVVEVFDYRVGSAGAFYTMELLDGGDAQSLAPLEFRRACALMRDVCSALSLLHSRRLVHRDISPRNIRCTADGLAKLIDFGALIPMGVTAHVVGTPPFCAPEVVDLQMLDARTDLYSVGATLYFVLCGRHAYPARDFRQLRDLWQTPALSPLQLGRDIPQTLDDLVMELIQIDPQSRPGNAAEVMERLSAIGGLPLDEQLVVSQAYLSTPTLVGRQRKLSRIRRRCLEAQDGAGSCVLVEAAAGLGRTRFLAACALEAKLQGNTVAHATAADAQGGAYGTVRALGLQLLETHPRTTLEVAGPHRAVLQPIFPELRLPEQAEKEEEVEGDSDEGPARRLRLQRALRAWFLAIAERHALALVVDDIDQIDEPSAALVALLAAEAGRQRMLIIASATSRDEGDEDAEDGEMTGPLELLGQLSSRVTLGALSLARAETLLGSIFGDVQHLPLVARRLHHVSGGNPRDLMQLAQHLVDRRLARYQAGSWWLPAQIDGADLPDSLARALCDRASKLGPQALELAQAFVLAPHESWSFEQCRALIGHDERAQLLSALHELTAADVIRTSGQRYALSQAGWVAALSATLTPDKKQTLHERIAKHFDAEGDDFRVGQHLLAAGQHERALDILVAHARDSKQQTNQDHDAWTQLLRSLPRDYKQTCEAALEACERMNRPQADRHALQTRMSSVLAATGREAAPVIMAVLRECEHAAGIDLHSQLEGLELSAGDKLNKALALAQARYEQLEPHERVFSPLEALRPLVAALVEGLGVVSNFYDRALWESLPSLDVLKPLAPAFVVVEDVRIALGKRLAGRYEIARDCYGRAIDRLAQPDQAGLPDSYHRSLRDGLQFARALVDAAMRSAATLEAADAFETRPFQLGRKRLEMLHALWQGDGEGADARRREFELARIQSNLAVPFEGGLTFTELCALVCSDDLTRLRRIMPEVERWAGRTASWLPMLHYAKGAQYRIGGDFERALEAFRQGLSLVAPGGHQLWPMLAGAELRCVLELHRDAEAVTLGRRYQREAREQGIDYPATHIDLALSQALCRTGEIALAKQLAADVVSNLKRLETGGVPLGLAYHNLARICLHAEDAEGFRNAARQCAAIFERSSNQALSTKYRRLMREARKAMRGALGPLDLIDDWDSGAAVTYLTTVFDTCDQIAQRAEVAATVLAKCCRAERVFLYLPGEDGPELAAAVGCYDPPPQMADAVSDFLDMELGRSDDITVTDYAEHGAQSPGKLWQSPSGESFYGVVLGHHEPKGFVISGVAVLVPDRATPFVHPGRVTAELSRLGLGAGPHAAVVRYSDAP